MIDLTRRHCLVGGAGLFLVGACGTTATARTNGVAGLTLVDTMPWWDESGCADHWAIPHKPTAPVLPGSPVNCDPSIF